MFSFITSLFSTFVPMQSKIWTLCFLIVLLGGFCKNADAQEIVDSIYNSNDESEYTHKGDTVFIRPADSVLRIKNFTPYYTLHVDSTLRYQFEINRNPSEYYWYLKNSPVGLRIDQNTGLLHFKASKNYFLSGKLKYDTKYKVSLGVQNLNDSKDKLDTTFTIVFYNTDIVPSKLKPTITAESFMEEGDTLRFRIQCETGSFPIEHITYITNYPISSLTPVNACDDEFSWVAPYDFIKESDKDKTKKLLINFVGVDKFFNRDTALVIVNVKDAIDYPARLTEYNKVTKLVKDYIEQLKSTFMVLDQKVKKNRGTRTTFELSSATTALGGTVFSSMKGEDAKTAGKIMPSVGVALVPVKEAVAPNKATDQNSASLVRSDIQRLQYSLNNTILIGEKDEEIVQKTNKLRDELKQIQLQLIDVPMVNVDATKTDIDKYFNSPKVKKKYRLKRQ